VSVGEISCLKVLQAAEKKHQHTQIENSRQYSICFKDIFSNCNNVDIAIGCFNFCKWIPDTCHQQKDFQ
jgi:hypothetical protein